MTDNFKEICMWNPDDSYSDEDCIVMVCQHGDRFRIEKIEDNPEFNRLLKIKLEECRRKRSA